MNDSFSSLTLADKLSKLNSSQQSIQSLSQWCIFQRKKANQIVETWEKLFISSPNEQRVSFLYLANDILQNSRRKGSDFVNEFWKVLPGTLKSVCENDDGHGKTVVMRLVNIWDERKVFGSCGRGLKDAILGKVPASDSNGKSLNPIKVVRKDSYSVRIKLAIGGMPERIVTAYQSVLDEHFKEDTALNKCKAAVSDVEKLEKDVDSACTQGIPQGSPLIHETHEHETILKQCIEQLQSVEATRTALIGHLKEALQEQEAKVELIHHQLQVAQSKIENAASIRLMLVSVPPKIGLDLDPHPTRTSVHVEEALVAEPNPPLQRSSTPSPQPPQLVSSFPNSYSASPPQQLQTVTSVANPLCSPPPKLPQSVGVPPPQPLQSASSLMSSFTVSLPQSSKPVTSSTNSFSAEEQNKKAAAAVAAKLTASTSSAQMFSSIVSLLVAEEAASKKVGPSSGFYTGNPPIFPPEKKPKLEAPMPVSDMNNTYFGHVQQQQQLTSLPPTLPQVSATSIQPITQVNQPQTPFPPPPPPPPMPPLPPPQTQQFAHSSGVMAGGMPYNFAGNIVPPPPLTSYLSVGLARPSAPHPQPPLPPLPPPQQQLQQQQQQNSAATRFFHPSGIGFFGQLQTAPPIPPQRGSVANQGFST